MIRFYYHPSPNPAKIALFLEEAGLPYELVPVDTRKGDQFKPDFLAINPNGKTPALTDGNVKIFDSNAILLYLAEKTGQFLPPDTPEMRGQMLSWLMFVATGIGPYTGQSVHFSRFAPEKLPYAINRYAREAERHWGLLDDQLGTWRSGAGRRGRSSPSATRPSPSSRTSAVISTRSRPGRRRSARWRSRTGSPGKPRSTTRRGRSSSRRTRF